MCDLRRIGELIFDWRQSWINGNFASTLMHCEWKIEMVSQCRISYIRAEIWSTISFYFVEHPKI